jgi:serine/threonine-protein kinase
VSADSKPSLINTWGTFPAGPIRLQLRQIILVAATVLWVAITCFNTGTKGIMAFALNAAFVFSLFFLGGTTRTIPIAVVSMIALWGGFMMGLAGLIGGQIVAYMGISNQLLPMTQAPLEEFLKLVPVLLFLERGKQFSIWTYGATDILILGVASGAGFAFVEDAYVHATSGWQNQIVWLPSAEIVNGRMIAGHAIWTGLACGTIGLALLWRHHKRLAAILAVAGLAWSTIDHIANDYAFTTSDWRSTVLNFVSANGYITILLFILCLIAAIIFDRFILFKALPKVPEFRLPSSKEAAATLKNFWEFVLDRRRLAYAYYRYQHAQGADRQECALVVSTLMQHLVNCHKPQILLSTDQAKTVVASLHFSEDGERFSDDPLLGLPERYLIVDPLSEGGMGVIYKAQHSLTGAKLAIKVLHPHLATHHFNILRFEQEARAASALKHPNLVIVHDFGLTKKQVPFLVMELIEGTDLHKEIRDAGPLSLKRFLTIFIQAADALSHAHKRGVIHRDIKPGNMILEITDDGSDFIRIVDFGIAKFIKQEGLETQQITPPGDSFGSPLYMSPEQCMGLNVDFRSDIYSLGCVMYECITGRPPLMGMNSIQTIFKQIHEMPERPKNLRKDVEIPSALEQVLFKSLQKDPDARYASMDELKHALEQVKQTTVTQ